MVDIPDIVHPLLSTESRVILKMDMILIRVSLRRWIGDILQGTALSDVNLCV
jgi:hypothetical protein